jgi:hypothetical protein
MEWHCTTDGVTWPGCGRCGPCRDAAPDVFAEAARLRRELSETRLALHHERRRRQQAERATLHLRLASR